MMKDLAARIRSGERDFTEDEFELLAECCERCPPLRGYELSRLRDKVIADHVTILTTIAGFKTEAAVADAERKFGLKRPGVFRALRKHSTDCAALKKVIADAVDKMSLARSLTAIGAAEQLFDIENSASIAPI